MQKSSEGEWDYSTGLHCEIYDKNFSTISLFNCNQPKWTSDGTYLLDSVQYEGRKLVVYINPLTEELKPADTFQWLNEYPDNAQWVLWELQPK